MPRLLALLVVCWAAVAGGAERLPSGAGKFEVSHNGKTVPVWYYLPENASPATPVLIVMHGVNRDADRYLAEWLPHARDHRLLLLVPEFSKEAFPGELVYNQGNTRDAEGRPLPRDAWTFGFIEPIFDAAKVRAGNESSRYSLYGHSAGAQFVHRFLYCTPEARVATAVAANAGFWTLPDGEQDYPYGLRGSAIDDAGLKQMLGRPLVVLLGTNDTDANHLNLRRTPEAMAQGPHRFARGRTFFESGRKKAAELGVPFGWTLQTAPGVPHENKGMAGYAVRRLFGTPTIVSRDPQCVRVLFGGDTGDGLSYQEQYVREGGVNILAEKGYEHGLVELRRLLAAVDYRVINLETPLTLRRDSTLTTKDYLHYSDPEKMPALFAPFGRVGYSLANNHTLDQGAAGLDDTLAALARSGADWFGGDVNLQKAARPLVQTFDLGGRTVDLAVFGAFEYREDYDRDYHFYAAADRPGTAPIDVAALKLGIAELRKTMPAAYVVYFVHWGGNYSWKNDEQTMLAHELRAAGVDLVVGHGAHALQEVEHDGRGWIFYSIGNFLFNTKGRYANYQATPYSMPLVLELTPTDQGLHTNLRGYPILSDNQQTGYQPRFLTDAELTDLEKLLAEKSGWNEAAQHLVKSGRDDVGAFFEFASP